MTGSVRRWPLYLIAAPAAVSIWSGWVGLGTLAGFGLVRPLPGIAPGFQLNTAITLPIGVEAVGAYALGAWLTPGTPQRARTFARRAAIGALALGMCGQIIYHLLAAAHATRAPWPVTMLVACLPVVTLGFGAALAHLLREPVAVLEATVEATPDDAAATTDERTGADAGELRAELARVRAARLAAQRGTERDRKRPPAAKQQGPVTPERVREHYADDLAAGQVPSIRRIRREWPVGYDRASELRAVLAGEA